jgi:hypothetical protein
MKIQNPSIYGVIYTLLSNDESLRDDWMSVIKNIHTIEMITKGLKKEKYFDLLFDSSSNNFSNIHSIRRVWQKVQEDNPHLRGVEWEERQVKGGKFNDKKMEEISNQLFIFSDEIMQDIAKIDLSDFNFESDN